MTQLGKARRPGAGPVTLALVIAVSLLAPASAFGELDPRASGELSARLNELAKPSVRTASRGSQAERLSLPRSGGGSLLRDGSRVLVYVRFAGDPDPGAAALRAGGAEVVHVADEYRTVTASVRPADLPRLADVPGVDSITEVLTPISSASSCRGLVTSEGDGQLEAERARNGFEVEGAGVTVGVISDSFDTSPIWSTTAGDDILSGDLPGPGNPCDRDEEVAVLQDLSPFSLPEPIDEGRAMAQIVHDLAPAASLAFATGFAGEQSFADTIRALAAPPSLGGAGAEIVVDDLIYPEEPFFQKGPIGVAIDEVASEGAVYFSSAGNNNLIGEEGDDISTWEAQEFRDTSCPPGVEALGPFDTCMDFDPLEGGPEDEDPTFGITVESGETLTLDLQWDEPRFGVTADLDVFLLDDEDNPVEVGGFPVGSGDNNISGSPTGTDEPLEFFGWENDTGEDEEVSLAITRCFRTEEEEEDEEPGCNPFSDREAMPRLKFLLFQNGAEGILGTEYEKSSEGDVVGPAIFGHTGSASAVSTGAVPFNDGSSPEPYSSRGPVTNHWGPVLDATPAAALAEPEAVQKPDLVATDCGLTTFFTPTFTPGIFRFCGTSASAPHAAAIAALMREANPSLTVAQVRTALAAGARPVGAFAPTAVGAGMVDAFDAVSRVALPPEVEITEGPQPLSANPLPRFAFVASRPVNFRCSIDEVVPTPCTSPFVPAAPLEDGEHTFSVTGTDLGNRSGTSEVESFAIDATAPLTIIRKRPKRVVRSRKKSIKVGFRFGSDEAGATFLCKVDRAPFRPCAAKLVRRFKLGKHKLRVKAQDTLGNIDPTPAVAGFRVKRKRR